MGRRASSSPTLATSSVTRSARATARCSPPTCSSSPPARSTSSGSARRRAEQLAEAEKLHRQINQYAYGPPPIRFSEQDVDQARAAGVVIELDHSTPIIVDRPLYRELAKGAVKRTVEELREQAERAKTERTQAASRRNGSQPEDPAEDARREHGRRVRELADQAHGANLDLGWALMNNLATVDPTDISVARFFVYGLFGSDYDGSPYTQSGDLVAELAARGIRLVIEQFRTDVTKTLKDGSRGKLRIDYGDPKQPEKPIAWLWKFIDGAKTAGELYGRALVVIAAEQHACRLVVPSSQRFGPSAGPRTKTTPPRRSRSWPARTSRRRSSTSRRRSRRQAPSCTPLRSRLAPRPTAEPSLFISQAPGPMPAPSTTQRSRTNAKTSATRAARGRGSRRYRLRSPIRRRRRLGHPAAGRVGRERREIRRVDDRSEPVVNARAVIRAATSSSGWLDPTSQALRPRAEQGVDERAYLGEQLGPRRRR